MTHPTSAMILSEPKRLVEKLEALLAALENPLTQKAAIADLHELAGAVESAGSDSLKLQVVPLPGVDEPIRLLITSAVFSPEYWGRTFAEGLLKRAESFDDKTVVELGTGSGWVSLMLLKRTGATRVLGLDINPVAVLMANLNRWLNGTTSDGTMILSQAGEPIVSAFQAQVSDLLAAPLSSDERFDHVIGCIPQVLHPDRSAVGPVGEGGSEQDLYDLSNYCFEQGILEDRFGLPLIARALEQAQLCLRPRGRVTLVLGGRPGPTAIEAMFRRRGFEPNLIWSRRIEQADDTDLASLVELESAHDIQFNFFMDMDSDLPVPASTAVRLLASGRPIYHDLLVYRAETRYEKPTLGLVANVHAMGIDSVRKELDFSRVQEEQISFMERLSRELMERRHLPYPHERGDLSLRERLFRFLAVYCHTAVDPERLFVGPERAQLVGIVLSMLMEPGQRVLISRSLEPVYGDLLARLGLDVVAGNDDLGELMELDLVTQPRVCMIAPRQLASPSPMVLAALSAHARKNPERIYLVDDSEGFDISSNLNANALIRLTSNRAMPGNLVFVYGLIKNTVCPDIELSFLLNAPSSWSGKLDVGAELTYSRIAYPTQLYYEWLFDEMLSFPFEADAGQPPDGSADVPFQASSSFNLAERDPVFEVKPISVERPGVIRLDYGEFEAAIPDALVKGLIRGFAEAPVDGLPDVIRHRVAAYLKATRGCSVEHDRVVIAQGAFPLMGALIACLRERLGRAPKVALPSGSYGPVYPLIAYHGGEVVEVGTDAASGFLMSADQLRALSPKPDLLWLTQPNNPSGLFYAADAVKQMMSVCAEREIFVLSDEIFFLLSSPSLGEWTPPSLSFGYHLDAPERQWLFLCDGLSKAFAAGGLRSGFMVCPDASFARQLQRSTFMPPRSTLRAWDALYSAFLEEAPHQLLDPGAELQEVSRYLTAARAQLDLQRKRLLHLLRERRLDDGLDTDHRGGLFVVARLGDRWEALAKDVGILVNPAKWGRTPDWARVCFSLEPAKFDEAMERLESYL